MAEPITKESLVTFIKDMRADIELNDFIFTNTVDWRPMTADEILNTLMRRFDIAETDLL